MILSIQSHVAYGRVGNRSAVLPLELLGHEVTAINTVQFSNHTGYGKWRGQIFSADHIRDIIQGIEERNALHCGAVLSGYMGSPDTGQVILEAVDRVKTYNADSIYCLDPVIGDYGRGIFVQDGIPELIKQEGVKRAFIITPNQFEAEYLSGISIQSLDDAKEAAGIISNQGPGVVIITSLNLNKKNNTIAMFLARNGRYWIIETEKFKFSVEPNGAGDLTAALFLGWYLKTGNAPDSLEKMTNSVFSVFQRTYDAGSREIDIVGSRFHIMTPPVMYRASEV